MYTSGRELSTTGYVRNTVTHMALMDGRTRTRRSFLRNSAVIGAAAAVAPHLATAFADQAASFRTPYKYPKLILSSAPARCWHWA
jgi:hypothetical protein